MPTPKFTNEMINAAILGFEGQKSRIDTQIAELRSMLPNPNGAAPETTVRKKRGMSAAGRAAIAEAQRKRWAATKEESVAPRPARKAKRKLSAAGRAAIIAATKKRWAAKRAEAAKA